jgi:signal peptidase I
MRIGFWKLFSAFALLLINLYLINLLGAPSLDPHLRLLGITPVTIPARSMAPTLERDIRYLEVPQTDHFAGIARNIL